MEKSQQLPHAESEQINFENVYVITVEVTYILSTGENNDTECFVDGVFATLEPAKKFANRVFRDECKTIVKDCANPSGVEVRKHTYNKRYKNGVVYMRHANIYELISFCDADDDDVTDARLSVKVYEIPFCDI